MLNKEKQSQSIGLGIALGTALGAIIGQVIFNNLASHWVRHQLGRCLWCSDR